MTLFDANVFWKLMWLWLPKPKVTTHLGPNGQANRIEMRWE